MKRALVPTALVIAACGFAMHAGFPCGDCVGSSVARADEPKPATPPTPATQATPAAPATPKGDEGKPLKLKVGDTAPALKADKWVKGTEVKAFEAGKVYVVEFWATWCAPCRESIPHLTDLQKKMKDKVVVIGMASSERKPESGEDKRLAGLEAFVKKQGEAMGYTVAYDADRKMAMDWLKAAGQNSIPTAFIVGKDGRIAWIGEPSDKEFEGAVQAAVGTVKKAAAGNRE